MSETTSDVRSRKAAVRRQMLQLRTAIPVDQRPNAAQAIAQRIDDLLVRRPGKPVVSGFLPIGDEIDPRPSMERAREHGCRICLPVMIGRNEPLQFRSWSPGDAMAQRQWGICEPLDSAEVLEPEVLLVPLLAFDPAGGRLGYGGGYYDRTLAGLRTRKDILAVGIGYDFQRIDSVPLLDYDEPLDWVLTPSGALECRGSPAR